MPWPFQNHEPHLPWLLRVGSWLFVGCFTLSFGGESSAEPNEPRWRHNETVSLEADDVDRRMLLEELASREGFHIEMRGQFRPDDLLSLSIEDMPIERVLARIIDHQSYAVIENRSGSSKFNLIILGQEHQDAAQAEEASEQVEGTEGSAFTTFALGTRKERLGVLATAAQLPSEEALGILETASFDSHDRRTRSRAVATLSRLRTREGEELLRRVAKESPDYQARLQAMRALAANLEGRATSTLEDIFLNETRTSLRLEALALSTRTGGDQAEGLIQAAMNDHDPRIRDAAREALESNTAVINQ